MKKDPSKEKLLEEVFDEKDVLIEGTVNILYKTFHDFGWTHKFDELSPSRKALKKLIHRLMKDSIYAGGVAVSSGRLCVSCAPEDIDDVYKGELHISLKVL